MKHMRDCPNNCNAEGKLYDRLTKTFILCPYCESVRKAELREGIVENEAGVKVDFKTQLGFRNTYLTGYYELDSIINNSERDLLDKESCEIVDEEVQRLLTTLTAGEIPEKSYCFGLARKGFVEHLAYPILSKAYEKGLSGCKFVSSRYYYSQYLKEKDVTELYEYDLICVHIATGSSYNELMVVKGLMETRAIYGKPTIFITNNDIDSCLLLLGSINQPSLYLASPYFIERSKTKDTHSFKSDGLRNIQSTNGSKIAIRGTSLDEELEDL